MADEAQAEQGRARSLLWQGVDFRIPIWGVAGAMFTVIWALISSHFGQQQLARDVAAVQATLTTGQEQSRVQFGQIALQASSSNVDVAELRIRITNLEAIVNRAYANSNATANANARAEAKSR